MPETLHASDAAAPLSSKRERFFHGVERLRALSCPLCGGLLQRVENDLRCGAGHHWNVHRKGYVTFHRGGDDALYHPGLFQARARVFDAGVFDPVAQAVLAEVPAHAAAVLDAGCGDGWYVARLMQARPGIAAVGVDLSVPAIASATDHPVPGVWCVGDLRRLPLADASMDAVLDILSPAAYGDFSRVLKKEGLLLKVYPQGDYLRELRWASGLPPHEPGAVEAHLSAHFPVRKKVRLRYEVPVTPALWHDLAHMTPMLAGLSAAEMEKVTQAPSAQVTMDLVLAVCAVP